MSDAIACSGLAKQLTVEGGLKFTAMQIGRIRNKVCTEGEDYNEAGKILPSGVVKICQHLDQELSDREQSKFELVQCRVLRQSTSNPRFIICMDTETKQRCLVSVPIKRKNALNVTNRLLKCERIQRDGEYFYSFAG